MGPIERAAKLRKILLLPEGRKGGLPARREKRKKKKKRRRFRLKKGKC